MLKFVERLQTFQASRAVEMQNVTDMLPDVPMEPWPDAVLMSSTLLLKRGRTGADKFVRTQAYSRHAAADGSEYYAMRRALARRDEDGSWHEIPDEDVQAPSRNLGKDMERLYNARCTEDLQDALGRLGATFPCKSESVIVSMKRAMCCNALSG